MSKQHSITNPPEGTFPVKVFFDDKKQKWQKRPATGKGVSWQDYQHAGSLANAEYFGVTIPQNVLVIDLDISEERSIEDLQAAIEEEFDATFEIDWGTAFIQSTISGGAHYAFAIPNDIEIIQQTNCKGITGFDLRVAGKGWICSGKGYSPEESIHDDIISSLHSSGLPSLPSIVIDTLEQNKVKIAGDGDECDDLLAAVNNNNLGLSDADIIEYMSRLPVSLADDQDDWFRVGMALYHETNGSDFGWELFDEFSLQCSDKYDEQANRSRWDSFNSDGGNVTTFASIIKWANDNTVKTAIIEAEANVETALEGLADVNDFASLKTYCHGIGKLGLDKVDISRVANVIKARDTSLVGSKLTIADIKAMLKNKKAKSVDAGTYVDDYVFMTSTAEYLNTITKTVMGPRAFDVKHTRETPYDLDDNPQMATGYVLDRIECVEGAMYAPMFGDTFTYGNIDFVNSYAPALIEPIKGDGDIVKRIIAHISHLLPNPVERDIVINYLAHNIQFPGVKLQWAIVLQGVQGDGKTLLAELMQLTLGINNVRLLNVQTLESSFPGWAAGQCITFIEELKLDNFRKYEILNNLKPYISNSTVEVTRKGVDPQVMLNTTNYFALTNFRDALPIDDNDRRYCILFSQWQDSDKLAAFEKKHPRYYSDIYDDMRAGSEELLHWLLGHKIPKAFLDTKRAPATAAKEAMKLLSKSDSYLLVEDAISEFESSMVNENVVNLTELAHKAESMFSDGLYKNFPQKNAAKNILVDMGYHHVGIYKNNKRKNQVIYCKDSEKRAIDFKNEINSCPTIADEF